MKLINLKLKNFLTFRELDHDFLNYPVLVQGKNLTEESKETNGSGKSTMMSGIAYAILATSLRKQTLDRELITWGEEESEIRLDIYCPIRNKTLNIHRTLRVKGSASLNLTIDEVEDSVQFATISDGNSYILNWIGISSEDLKNYFIINKENYKSFTAASNTDKLSLISRFIKANELDNSEEILKNYNTPLIEERKGYEGDINFTEGQLAVYNEQLMAERNRDLELEREADTERLNKQIDAILNTVDVCTYAIEKAENSISENNEVIESTNKIISEVTRELKFLTDVDFKEKYSAISDERTEVDRDITAKRCDLKNVLSEEIKVNQVVSKIGAILSGAVECPKCSHKFNLSDPNYDLTTIPKEIEEKKAILQGYKVDIENIGVNIKNLQNLISEFEVRYMEVSNLDKNTKTKVREMTDEIGNLTFKIQRAQRAITNLQAEIAENNNTIVKSSAEAEKLATKLEGIADEVYVTREEEIQGVITLTTKKVDKLKKLMSVCDERISDNTQWGIRFKEFKMSLACEQLKIIQDFANTALIKMKSELRLSIDGFKVDSKGKVKSEISVMVINGEGEYKSFWSFSGGERSRIEVALILAFQEMINSTNPHGGLHFLSIDEVLEGTDPLGMSLMLESMEDIHFPIYMISHVMNIRAGVPTITVVKENNYSYIR